MRNIQLNKIYKHFKDKYYFVLDIGVNTETMEEFVIYRALYDDCKLWVRPLNMFLEEVDHEKYPEIEQKYRFELVE